MQYDHILIRYGELGLKGRNMRQFLIRLQQNIQQKLTDFANVKVRRTQGRLFIQLNGHDPQPILEKCQKVFGIHSLSLAIKTEKDMASIKRAALFALENSEDTKTFKVIVRRVDKSFPIGSQKMNQLLGSHLLRKTENFQVDVHQPDVEVKVEIRADGTYITSKIIPGLKGLPVGTGGKSLLLLSGGIDSPVAGFLAMKRGVQLEAIHFHSPPFTSERAKQKVLDMTKVLTRYGNSIKVHLVPFTEIQQKIFKDIPDGYTMTVMRRVMLRISEMICKQEGILSLTTGESLGQVASQTMESMHTINEVTNYPVLRPLITMDKEEIVNISKKIDTYTISIRPYEDCCTIFMPRSPKTRPKRDKVKQLESETDYTYLINKAIQDTEVVRITGKPEQEETFKELL